MSKALICIEDGLLSIRLSRILQELSIAFDIVKTPIRREDLSRYDILAIHSSYKLTGLYPFIENLLIQRLIPVVFISLGAPSSWAHRLGENPMFTYVDESKIDVLLPFAISNIIKQAKLTETVIQENKKMKAQLETQHLMKEAKVILMSEGMSEEEAHAFILKKAMDEKSTKRVACLNILGKNKKSS